MRWAKWVNSKFPANYPNNLFPCFYTQVPSDQLWNRSKWAQLYFGRWSRDKQIWSNLGYDPFDVQNLDGYRHFDEAGEQHLMDYAEQQYKSAEDSNPNWWFAYYGSGELYFDVASDLEDQGQAVGLTKPPAVYAKRATEMVFRTNLDIIWRNRPPTALDLARSCVAHAAGQVPASPGTTIAADLYDRAGAYAEVAVGYFDEAIRLNSGEIDPYRDCAMAYTGIDA